MPALFSSKQRSVRARARLYAALREFFAAELFDEVETPCLVGAPGLEPHIRAFEVSFVPETPEGSARTLYLHTSPEYAMKRLLASGFERVFQIAKVFRNGEIATHHNPEFSMLEFYRAHVDYQAIMLDLEEIVVRGARAVAQAEEAQVEDRRIALTRPFERLTVREAFHSRTGVDLSQHGTFESLRAAAR